MRAALPALALLLALAAARPTVDVLLNGARAFSSQDAATYDHPEALLGDVAVRCNGRDSAEEHIDMYMEDLGTNRFIWGDSWASYVAETFSGDGIHSVRCQGRLDCGRHDMSERCRTYVTVNFGIGAGNVPGCPSERTCVGPGEAGYCQRFERMLSSSNARRYDEALRPFAGLLSMKVVACTDAYPCPAGCRDGQCLGGDGVVVHGRADGKPRDRAAADIVAAELGMPALADEDADPSKLGAGTVVLVGGPDVNPLTKSLQPRMALRFSDDMRTVLLGSERYDLTTGPLADAYEEAFISSFHRDGGRLLVILAGRTEGGTAKAAELFLESVCQWGFTSTLYGVRKGSGRVEELARDAGGPRVAELLCPGGSGLGIGAGRPVPYDTGVNLTIADLSPPATAQPDPSLLRCPSRQYGQAQEFRAAALDTLARAREYHLALLGHVRAVEEALGQQAGHCAQALAELAGAPLASGIASSCGIASLYEGAVAKTLDLARCDLPGRRPADYQRLADLRDACTVDGSASVIGGSGGASEAHARVALVSSFLGHAVSTYAELKARIEALIDAELRNAADPSNATLNVTGISSAIASLVEESGTDPRTNLTHADLQRLLGELIALARSPELAADVSPSGLGRAHAGLPMAGPCGEFRGTVRDGNTDRWTRSQLASLGSLAALNETRLFITSSDCLSYDIPGEPDCESFCLGRCPSSRGGRCHLDLAVCECATADGRSALTDRPCRSRVDDRARLRYLACCVRQSGAFGGYARGTPSARPPGAAAAPEGGCGVGATVEGVTFDECRRDPGEVCCRLGGLEPEFRLDPECRPGCQDQCDIVFAQDEAGRTACLLSCPETSAPCARGEDGRRCAVRGELGRCCAERCAPSSVGCEGYEACAAACEGRFAGEPALALECAAFCASVPVECERRCLSAAPTAERAACLQACPNGRDDDRDGRADEDGSDGRDDDGDGVVDEDGAGGEVAPSTAECEGRCLGAAGGLDCIRACKALAPRLHASLSLLTRRGASRTVAAGEWVQLLVELENDGPLPFSGDAWPELVYSSGCSCRACEGGVPCACACEERRRWLDAVRDVAVAPGRAARLVTGFFQVDRELLVRAVQPRLVLKDPLGHELGSFEGDVSYVVVEDRRLIVLDARFEREGVEAVSAHPQDLVRGLVLLAPLSPQGLAGGLNLTVFAVDGDGVVPGSEASVALGEGGGWEAGRVVPTAEFPAPQAVGGEARLLGLGLVLRDGAGGVILERRLGAQGFDHRSCSGRVVTQACDEQRVVVRTEYPRSYLVVRPLSLSVADAWFADPDGRTLGPAGGEAPPAARGLVRLRNPQGRAFSGRVQLSLVLRDGSFVLGSEGGGDASIAAGDSLELSSQLVPVAPGSSYRMTVRARDGSGAVWLDALVDPLLFPAAELSALSSDVGGEGTRMPVFATMAYGSCLIELRCEGCLPTCEVRVEPSSCSVSTRGCGCECSVARTGG